MLAANYATSVADGASQLPAEAAGLYTDSIGGAVVVATQTGGQAGARLLDLANAAFIDAMSTTVLIGALFATAGAAIAIRWLPSRPPVTDPLTPAPDPRPAQGPA